MFVLILVVVATVLVSAFCSVVEALVLSTTIADIEGFKKVHLKQGLLLEKLKINIEETSSAILSLNTMCNTLGAIIAGGLATELWGQQRLGYFSIAFTFIMLFFAEILPKNMGILYRKRLQPYFIYPLVIVVRGMAPITLLCARGIRMFLRKKQEKPSEIEEEILLLTEKSVQEGGLTVNERNMIVNAIELDHIAVEAMMTPRSVVTAFDEGLSVESICKDHMSEALSFARIPIYQGSLDTVTGFVRRREVLKAKVNGQESKRLIDLKDEVLFIQTRATGADALKLFLKHHEQIAIVTDEFGLVMGIITMEDIIEQVLGQEIFEKGDVAVDMRELARKKISPDQQA